MKRESRIILALDVTEKEKALNIAKKLNDHIDAIKINYPLILAQGMAFINELTKLNDVICDIKLADIPNTNRLIAKEFKKYDVVGLIMHGFVGSDAIADTVSEFSPKEVYVVAEMSHPGAVEYMQQHGESIANIARQNGAKGIIVPGTRPERIRLYRELVGDLKILVPGIGVQGGDAKTAILNGADYLIIGRSLYESKDLVKAAIEFKKQIVP